MALFAFHSHPLTALTAVGVTPAVEVKATDLTFQVTVSDIGTNVVIRLEGSVDGTSYMNLAEDESDYTITADGTTGYVLYAPVNFVRLRLVSFSGGSPSVATVIGGK
jgi:hypothetical protein